MKDYEILPELTLGGFHVIEITRGSFAGVKFFYTRVSISEGHDGIPILHFTYNLVDGEIPPNKEEAFKLRIGDILLEIMGEQLVKNEVVYTGGT